jgi:hypothetical protein
MILSKEQKERLTELLEEVQDWMLSNDYECGEHGSIIYDKVSTVIRELNNPDEYNTTTKSVVS